jgi:hypothetical protein
MSSVTPASGGPALGVAPSLAFSEELEVSVATSVRARCPIVGVLTGSSGRVDARLGLGRSQLDALGFTGTVGTTHSAADGDGSVQVAVGVGDPGDCRHGGRA